MCVSAKHECMFSVAWFQLGLGKINAMRMGAGGARLEFTQGLSLVSSAVAWSRLSN